MIWKRLLCKFVLVWTSVLHGTRHSWGYSLHPLDSILTHGPSALGWHSYPPWLFPHLCSLRFSAIACTLHSLVMNLRTSKISVKISGNSTLFIYAFFSPSHVATLTNTHTTVTFSFHNIANSGHDLIMPHRKECSEGHGIWKHTKAKRQAYSKEPKNLHGKNSWDLALLPQGYQLLKCFQVA